MLILVSHDVSTTTSAGQRRLRQIARACQNHGQLVQYSVFEIEVDTAQWLPLKNTLCDLIDPTTDSLRFYYFGKNRKHKIEHIDAKPPLDLRGPLIL